MIPNKWENTGIYAVDLVARCVSHHRYFMIPLKTIWLKPKLWMEFAAYVQFLHERQKKEIEISPETCQLEFDSVNINKGVPFQHDDLMCEFYDANPPAKEKKISTPKKSLIHLDA